MDTIQQAGQRWPLWRRIIFRFFFIYFLLNISPWTWLNDVPGFSYLNDLYSKIIDWAVYFANDHLFHVRKVLVPLNGSGQAGVGIKLKSSRLIYQGVDVADVVLTPK